MSFIVKPSRNPTVQAAWAGLRAAERREKRIHNAYRTKPLAELPQAKPAKKSTNAKPPAKKAAKKGKR